MKRMLEGHIDIVEAAQLSGVTTQAIYSAIKKYGLPALKQGHKWWVRPCDLAEYKKHRYSRMKRKLNGQFIFDKEKGMFSVNDATIIISQSTGMKFSTQQTYYFIRIGRLKAHRMGASWVVASDAITEFVNQLRSKEENISAKII